MDITPPEGRRPRTVAFYLPQFHQIPENDRWWGEGFTDWVNVRRAQPQFDRHDHPQHPGELAEYDLSDVSVMHRQADLARAYDVDAFCFYFYWFAGTRLLERPLEQYLRDGPDFPFCISWANESWTRRWDGKDHEYLMLQRYDETTATEIFNAFLPALRDRRYLRVDGAAVIIVHRADQLPDGSAYATTWKRLANRSGVGPLHLVAAETHPGITPGSVGFDATVEFPPVGANTLRTARLLPLRGLNHGFRGRLMSYPRLVSRYMRRREATFVRYRCVVPGWDNTARRGEAATVYLDSNPVDYRRWLMNSRTVEHRLRGAQGLVFINAWNEWAEGAHLEPDQSDGRAFLEATRWNGQATRSRKPALRLGLPSIAWVRSLALVCAGSALQTMRRAQAKNIH